MRALIERVCEAAIKVGGEYVARIGKGLVVYVGIEKGDSDSDIDYIANKIISCRIFEDDEGKMNLSVQDVAGKILVIPAFSLQADLRRGRRPSFDAAMPPSEARVLFDRLLSRLGTLSNVSFQSGIFSAHMHIEAINDGPVCLLLDSRRAF